MVVLSVGCRMQCALLHHSNTQSLQGCADAFWVKLLLLHMYTVSKGPEEFGVPCIAPAACMQMGYRQQHECNVHDVHACMVIALLGHITPSNISGMFSIQPVGLGTWN